MSHKEPVRVLIWAPYGAGPHYWGPGQNVWRLVRFMDERYAGEFVFELAHGYPDQKPVAPFRAMHYIHPLVSGSVSSLARFLRKSRQWLKRHAGEYGALHSVSSYDAGLMPAVWFRRYNPLGTATTRIATKGEGLWPGSLPARMLMRHHIRRRKVRSLSAVIALSSDIEADLKAIAGPVNVLRIPNGVDTTQFSPATPSEKPTAREALGIPDRFTVLFVGSVSARKRPHLLVESLRHLPPEVQPIQLILAGPVREGAAEYERITALLKETPSLKDQVHMYEFREDTTMLYSASDLFALPSKKEGMSNALLEAQSAGLPAIVTAVSGSRDVVEHQHNGFLVEANPQEIAARVTELARDPELCGRMGSQARDRMVAHFSLDTVAARYHTLWQG